MFIVMQTHDELTNQHLYLYRYKDEVQLCLKQLSSVETPKITSRFFKDVDEAKKRYLEIVKIMLRKVGSYEERSNIIEKELD